MSYNWRSAVLTVIVLLILFPFIYLLGLSFASDWRFPAIIPEYIGFKNWEAITNSDAGLLASLGTSILIALLVASTATLSGFMIGRMVSYHRMKNKLLLLTYFPYVLAPVVFGVCLSYFFLKIGIFGTTFGVITAQFLIAFPYAVIFFSSFWGRRTKNFEDLVSTMGGNKTQTYVRVLFPLAKGMILICFFQTFLISWFEYGLTSVIGIGKVQTLTVKVFLFIKEANFYYGALSSCLLIFPPVLLLYINKRYVFNKLI